MLAITAVSNHTARIAKEKKRHASADFVGSRLVASNALVSSGARQRLWRRALEVLEGLHVEANVISYSAFICCQPPWPMALRCLQSCQEQKLQVTLEVYNAALGLEGGAVQFLDALQEQRLKPDLLSICCVVEQGVDGKLDQLRMQTLRLLRSRRPAAPFEDV
eukprot:s285_g20.t1